MSDSLLWIWIIPAVGGYLLGSVPFGLVLAKAFGYGDIRTIGSGNIGATNVLRTGSKPLALATLLLDGGKGAFAMLACAAGIGYEAGLVAGFAAIIGHNFPVWLRFKGGKGVATTLGVLLAADFPVGIAACLTWLVTAIVFRYSSLAAIAALASSPFWAYWLNGGAMVAMAAALAVLGIARHHTNIRRLVRGTEPKIGQRNDS